MRENTERGVEATEQLRQFGYAFGQRMNDVAKNIDCVVETTDAVVKGQTAASSYKPAKLNNGLTITVPPFIENGDKIIIDSRSLEYVKKNN